MKINIYASPNLFVEHAREIEAVLRQAVRDALLMHKRAGNTIAEWKNGKLHLVKAEDIVVDSVETTEHP
jgi:hypothetical protein